MAEYGYSIKADKAAKLESQLAPSLAPDEVVWLIVKANGLSPLIDHWVVTSSRILAVFSADLVNPIKRQVSCKEFVGESVGFSATAYRMLTLRDPHGGAIKFGNVQHKPDVPLVLRTLERLRRDGTAAQAPGAGLLDDAVVVRAQIQGQIGRKALEQIRDHAAEGERPWFVLSCAGGVLAAFDDRLMIIKSGGWTGMAAGAVGGGRTTTIMYHDITGLEYNAGFTNGVLEVLTASYQGTANQDHWQGSFRPTNSKSGSPYALSNTLPLDKATYARALAQLNDLRKRIAASKTPTVVVQAQAGPAERTSGSVADELSKLADLLSNGVLTDEEFSDAKATLLSQLKSGQAGI